MKEIKLDKKNTTLLEVIHNFIKITASAESSQEVFTAITTNFMKMIEVEECVVYEAFVAEKKLILKASHGSRNPKGEIDSKLEKLNFDQGIVGWAAENQQTVCVGNTNLDKRYLVDKHINLSELSVPIQFNGELFGIIDSENSEENFYSREHVQLFELIAELAASLLVRIRQKEELAALKRELEDVLSNKKRALDEAIETVSEQVSELKYHEDKRAILIREVQHRVNNNLQILSSLTNIYLTESEEINRDILKEIQLKVQTLSSIHLILLKSVENNRPSVQDFLLDLIASIRYTNESNYLVLNVQCWAPVFSMNTLIPLGMLINELILNSCSKFWKKGETIELNIAVIFSVDSSFILEISTNDAVSEKQNHANLNVSDILIDAFVDQLDGEKLATQKAETLWRIKLKEIE